jgi:tetratricopeptide (TPR) repeat protein
MGLIAIGCQTAKRPIATEGDIQGVVFDLDKAPVNDAHIELQGPNSTVTAITDSQGRFTLSGLTVGDYSLSFSKTMYERRTWPVSFYDFTNVFYLQTASYWQLLDAALASLGEKEYNSADDYLQRAKNILEKSSTSLFLLGVLAERRGDIASAISDLETAVTLDEKSPYLWLYLADLYEHNDGLREKTVNALDKYLNLRDDPSVEERRKAISQ